ncbi:extracellular solute-binding protein [Brachybacterium muris]|uniref:sugar ABC transporter substrate-binding protein n=1 Tax=Brachybacterium muris TaxID=219301 RepID=UPI00223BE6DE|nr:extracellular solute-binding protein [Brachybacterium muris]MCT1997441.1 extracellular solute-binding protein [Brachybacterium muris]MCT2260442.1 extracellular solute-binding protein [Brachybacterium muris]MCT2296839.1 extracellular solute-binding protein [Brachybacterium muris]
MQIRRKNFLALSGVAASVTLLAACGGDSDTDGGTGGGASDAGGASDGGGETAEGVPARGNADLVIWADELKAKSLQEPAKTWADAQGITVEVQTVANDLQTNYVTANQAGNGPDIVLGAHDWIGNLVQNGAISPVQLPGDAADKLAPIGLQAVTYDGQTYGVPYAVETLVLYANNALTDVPEPGSIEELVEAAKAGGAEVVLSLPVGEQGDAYHMQPLYTSGGGYLFGTDAEGNQDPTDLGVGKEGSIAAGEKIGALGADGVLRTSITGDNAISLFTDGKAAYLISGPWALGDINTAGIDFTMSAVPGFEGMEPAKPFAGVNAFYVASNGQNAGFAQTFVGEVASNAEIAEQMFQSNNLPPVNLELQEKLSGEFPDMVKIAEFAELAEPMPSIPQMAAIWGPLGQAQANIVGGADPASTMQAAGEEIARQIG